MLCLREFGRSATRLFLWFWRVGPLSATTLNQMIKASNPTPVPCGFYCIFFNLKTQKLFVFVCVGLCLYLLSAYVSWFWLVSSYISVFSTNWNHSVKQDLLCGLMSRIGVSYGISFNDTYLQAPHKKASLHAFGQDGDCIRHGGHQPDEPMAFSDGLRQQ